MMRIWSLGFLVPCLLITARAEALENENDRLVVILTPKAEVGGFEYTLSEVAKLSGTSSVYRKVARSLRLGYSPLPGKETRLSSASVSEQLVRSGIPEERLSHRRCKQLRRSSEDSRDRIGRSRSHRAGVPGCGVSQGWHRRLRRPGAGFAGSHSCPGDSCGSAALLQLSR